MVSTQITSLSTGKKGKLLGTQLLFAASIPDAEYFEMDFSDVFGPMPVQPPKEVTCGDLGNSVSRDITKVVFDEPAVVYNRSHSLVGPTSCVCQSLKLSKLTVGESIDLLEFVEEGTIRDVKEDYVDDCASEELVKDVGGDSVKVDRVGLEDFEVLKLVGQGGFGKVFQVRKKGTSEIYAMKVLRKDKIMEKNHARYMQAERDILKKIDHPFIVQLKFSFQTKYRLYLVLDFVNGGHLFFQLYHQGLFREDLARVYAAEIVSAVSHLHEKGIMHRDLKPENILLDADGHVMLTDFGLAKEFDENTRANSMCGTTEYMSPEIIKGKGHNKAADWWSIGILLYEMLTGEPPFLGNKKKIQQKIVNDKVKLPSFLTSEAHTLLKGLLQKDPSKRLGSGPTGDEEIKRHKWFKPINWKKLEAREIQPSFRPDVNGDLCIANFDKRYTDMPLLDSPAASPKINSNNPFVNFTYVRPAASFLREDSSLLASSC